jgi:hypothetical protein
MLPPGHIAAGYLASDIVLRTFNFNLSFAETSQLLWLGTFFGFMPDLDFFIAFTKSGKMRINNDTANHRRLLTHVPITWLLISALIFFIGQTVFTDAVAVLLLACTWIHFLLDSEWGIMWLWPFQDRMLPFSPEFYKRKYSMAQPSSDLSFWKYWWNVFFGYFRKPQAWIEIIIIAIAIIYYIILN